MKLEVLNEIKEDKKYSLVPIARERNRLEIAVLNEEDWVFVPLGTFTDAGEFQLYSRREVDGLCLDDRGQIIVRDFDGNILNKDIIKKRKE